MRYHIIAQKKGFEPDIVFFKGFEKPTDQKRERVDVRTMFFAEATSVRIKEKKHRILEFCSNSGDLV